jgi:aryl-alcohol dehydrogenase-like predicted oxidoreductase
MKRDFERDIIPMARHSGMALAASGPLKFQLCPRPMGHEEQRGEKKETGATENPVVNCEVHAVSKA